MRRVLAERGDLGPRRDRAADGARGTSHPVRQADPLRTPAAERPLDRGARPSDADGGEVAIVRDISERKQREMEVEEARQRLERQAADLIAASGELTVGPGRGRGRACPCRGGEPGEVRIPRQHEPRNPHADERRAGHGEPAAVERSRHRAAILCRGDPGLGRKPAGDHQRHSRHLEAGSRPGSNSTRSISIWRPSSRAWSRSWRPKPRKSGCRSARWCIRPPRAISVATRTACARC